MLKKIFLILILILLNFNLSFWDGEKVSYETSVSNYSEAQKNFSQTQKAYNSYVSSEKKLNEAKKNLETAQENKKEVKKAQEELSKAQESFNKEKKSAEKALGKNDVTWEDLKTSLETKVAENKEALWEAQKQFNKAKKDYKNSDEYIQKDWKNDISSWWFEMDIGKITPWKNSMLSGTNGNTKEVLNKTFWIVIKKLMIWLWSVSLLIMTIGWAYMILYHGQDELLSKWKYMFLSWIIALIVSLSSYYLVNLLRYILYS